MILTSFSSLAAEGAQLWLDPYSANAAVMHTYKLSRDKYIESTGNKRKYKAKTYDDVNGRSAGAAGVFRPSPVSVSKALKNTAELEGMRNSHLR